MVRGHNLSLTTRRRLRRLPETVALANKLEALAAMPPAQLRDEWQRLYKVPAPRVSANVLTCGIGWALQERALGGLSPNHARELKRLVAGRANGGTPFIPVSAVRMNASDLRPGTTLMRSWGDRSWSVLVTEDGLVFEGRRYASLSMIAREITGAHWSGPRFFGLGASARAQGRGPVNA